MSGTARLSIVAYWNGLFGLLKLLGDLNHLEETSSHPMIPDFYLGVQHL
jgi:hypothetical protein